MTCEDEGRAKLEAIGKYRKGYSQRGWYRVNLGVGVPTMTHTAYMQKHMVEQSITD